MAWTKEQQAAIDSRGQTLLLSAAAGSGKTAVLVERIIQRLLDKDNPIDITELLVVTFTKAAAAEMRDRVAAALMEALSKEEGKDSLGMIERQLALLPSAHISTLHSFCQDVIRQYFYRLDIDPAFIIAGQEELALLRRTVLADIFLTYYEDDKKAPLVYPLADMFGNDRGDDILMDTVEHIYDYSRSMPWPEQWLDDAVKAYDISSDTVLDDEPWCAPIKQRIRRIVEEKISLYDDLLEQMKLRSAFAAIVDQFASERMALQSILDQRSWEGMGKAVQVITFERLKALRNLSEEDKLFWETCKATRTSIKKDVMESLQQIYFTVSPQDWLQGMKAMLPVMTGLVELTKDFASAYGKAKKEKGWIDFSDLEHYCLQILLDESSKPNHPIPSAAAEELRQSYKEILIDEYQDTNGVQELITRLVSEDNNRFMVGDIKQSIYRFRLADPTLFLEKYTSFSREEKAVHRCIDLSKNFRSAPNILEGVNEVFARAMTAEAAGMDYGSKEKLYAGRESPSAPNWVGGPIEVHLLDTASVDSGQISDEESEGRELTAFEKESRIIAKRIVDLKASGVTIAEKDGTMVPLSYRHIVILMRSMAGKAEVLLEALQAAGIPAFAEQNGGYFAASEVQVMLSLLRCIDNPEQDLPMAAVLRSSLCGMDEAELAALRLADSATLWQNMPRYIEQLEGDKKESLQAFYTSLENWRTFGRRHGVAELLQHIYSETSYYDYVGGMPGGSVRQANLQALYNRAGQYEKSGFRGIFRYLQLIDKMQDDGIDLAPAKVIGEGEDVVRIMSIHKSKGLEFPVVIIADMGKAFNRQDLQSPTLLHKTLGIGIKQYDSVWRMLYPTFIWSGIAAQLSWESTAEEERILYVAMTRAKDKLILMGHSGHLKKDWQRWQSNLSPALGQSYFDWVLPVLAGQKECQFVDQAIEVGQDMEWDCGLWHLALHHGTGVSTVTESVLQQEPRLNCLRDGLVSNTVIPQWMDETLSWQYGYGQAVVTPAKFSVSEIKRQHGLLHADELREEESLAVSASPKADEEDVFGTAPPWLQEKEEAASGARRGTAIHKVMQYLAIRPELTVHELDDEMARWEADGLFTAEEKKWVHRSKILAFCQSDLGQRMAQSPEIRREYPFSVLFTGGQYLPDLERDERVLVQGVVDCLFREDDKWVLVDYKTDRLEEETDFCKRYAVQLALYKRALEQISGADIKDVYIYSFYLNTTIPVSCT